MSLKDLFSNNRDEIWAQLATQLGGTFEKGKLFSSPELRCQAGPWEIVLDTYSSGNDNSQTFTRLRAPFLSKDPFAMKIFPENVLTRLGKKLGMDDLQTGFKDFDDAFVVQSNRKDPVMQLLRDDTLRQLLLNHKDVTLGIKDHEGIFRKRYPKGVDVLYASRRGSIKIWMSSAVCMRCLRSFWNEWSKSMPRTSATRVFRYKAAAYSGQCTLSSSSISGPHWISAN